MPLNKTRLNFVMGDVSRLPFEQIDGEQEDHQAEESGPLLEERFEHHSPSGARGESRVGTEGSARKLCRAGTT
jgi:hypothetical protein